MASSISSNSKIYIVTSFDEYFALNNFYNSGFLLSNPYTERNTWRIEFEVTGKWSAWWQERIDKSFNVITILKKLDRTWSTDVKLVSIRLKKLFPSKRSTHVFTFFRPRKRPRTLPFFSFPLWWFAWTSKSVGKKTFRKLIKIRTRNTNCKKLKESEELTPSSESPSLEPMLTRLP